MKNIITLALFLICANMYAQDIQGLPGLLGVNTAINGKIRADDISWLNKTTGGTLFFQIPGIDGDDKIHILSAILEMTALVKSDTASMTDFKYYLNGKFGVGLVLFRKKRINIPIHGNLGYSHIMVNKAENNFGGVSVGYAVGVNFFLTRKTSVIMRYCYDYIYTDKINFAGYSELEGLTYTTNYFSAGLGFSLHKKTKNKFVKHYQI
jgi:hypothetical protein